MLPMLYHAHTSLDSEDIDFWHEMARQQASPILELGCGTGRVLFGLVQAGFKVFGIDKDLHMLGYLRSNLLTMHTSNTCLIQGDFCAFHLAVKFALIILPCNTFSTLSGVQRALTLERVHWHLQPEGIFITSIPNPSYLRQLPRQVDPEVEEIFPHPQDGEPVQVSSAWKRSTNQMVITWMYDHLKSDGEVERYSYRVTQHIIPVETIVEEIQNAGLEVIHLYGDFDGAPFTEESTYLILISRKASSGQF